MALLDLQCINGCREGRFEALNAPLIVDRAGRYIEHDARIATYVCAVCQGVAVDLAAVAREMRRGDEPLVAITLRCPNCGLDMLPPEDDPQATVVECPACETRFQFEEGVRRLHGGGNQPDDA
jgi:hypothetical protein